MKIILKYLIVFAAINIALSSCNKQDDFPENTTDKIIIDSLVASQYIVMAWDTTTISCFATGDSLSYHWECDHGSINGSGTQIKYAAGQCCIGINTITCMVSNYRGEVYGSIKIEVTPYIQP